MVGKSMRCVALILCAVVAFPKLTANKERARALRYCLDRHHEIVWCLRRPAAPWEE